MREDSGFMEVFSSDSDIGRDRGRSSSFRAGSSGHWLLGKCKQVGAPGRMLQRGFGLRIFEEGSRRGRHGGSFWDVGRQQTPPN